MALSRRQEPYLSRDEWQLEDSLNVVANLSEWVGPGDIVHKLYICLDISVRAQNRSLWAAVSTQQIKSE